MTESSFHLYEVEVEWHKEREGELKSVGLANLKVSSPPEFKGVEGVWTPEHLFVASVNSCFMLTFLAIAETSKLAFQSFNSQAQGKLEKLPGLGYQITEITLKVKLVVNEQVDLERASRILEKAEKNCFISNSIKTTVKLEREVSFN